jgi:predicted Ser/Thr protein kinase
MFKNDKAWIIDLEHAMVWIQKVSPNAHKFKAYLFASGLFVGYSFLLVNARV